jgi:K+-sensing histidine kinase KdpD
MQLPGWLGRDRMAFAAALIGPLAGCAVLSSFRDSFPNTDAALVLVLVVVAVAAAGSRLAGDLAALSAALWFDFFLTRPYDRFAINRHADVKTTVLLLAVGVAVTELAVWGRRQAAMASGRAADLAGIREATEVVSTGGSGWDLERTVAKSLVALLGLASCQFEYGVAGVGEPALMRHDGEVEWRHRAWDVDRSGLPVDVDTELIVESGGRLVGRYLMRAARDSRPSLSQRLVAVTLADQVGAALGHSR